MAAINRGYAELAGAINNAGVRPSSANWLIQAFDPYHDNPIKLEGLPDRFTGNSVVREIKQTVTVTRPSYFQGDSCDLRIDMLPTLTSFLVQPLGYDPTTGGGILQRTESPGSNGAFRQWPLNISWLDGTGETHIYPDPRTQGVSIDSSTGAWPQQYGIAKPTFAGFDLNGLEVPAEIIGSGRHRLLGAGFEVINTTNKLNIGGTCTVYRVPNLDTNAEMAVRVTRFPSEEVQEPVLTTEVTNFRKFPLPPPLLADLMLLPNTKQWKADEGCYCIQRLDPHRLTKFASTQEYVPRLYSNCDSQVLRGTNHASVLTNNEVVHPVWVDSMVTPPEDKITSGYARNDQIYAGGIPLLGNQNITTTNGVIVPRVTLTSGDLVGAYFTGLPNESSFTINVKWIIETVPDFLSPLQTLATQAAGYDARALKLYFEASQSLPAGVFQSENPFGEWFETVMSFVSQYAAKAGGAIGGALGAPGFGTAIGGGISYLATTARQQNRRFRMGYD